MSCQARPGLEPGPSALKASALHIELTGAGILPNRSGLLQAGKATSHDPFSNAAANFQSYQT